MQRGELLNELRERINQFGAGGKPAIILSEETRKVAARLRESVDDPAGDFDVMHALGWFHWARYLALPKGQDQADLTTATQLLIVVYYDDPDSVPDEMRRYFDQKYHGVADARGWAKAGSEALQQALRTRNPAAVDMAINYLGMALPDIPDNHPDFAMNSANLAAALGMRSERTGDPADLTQAIEMAERAVRACSPSHPNRGGYLGNLAAALSIRFARTGSLADLNRLIDVAEQSVAATPDGDPGQAEHLSRLASALQDRYERTGDIGDLNRAIEVGERIVP